MLGAAIIAAFAWAVWSVISVPAPFAYDEAVYASQTRHLLEDAPDTTWRPHRAPGLPLLGVPVHQVTASEHGFRVVGAVFAVATLAGVWWLAAMVARASTGTRTTDRLRGPAVAGVVAMGVLALAPPVVEAAGRFLTDLPAAGLLVLAAAVLWRSLEARGGPTWGLLTAAPLLAAAFYLRFGSALFVGLLGVVAGAVWWRRIRARPAPVLAAGVLFLALLSPHAIAATTEFGAPWGQLLHTTRVVAAETDEPVAGLRGYLDMLPFELAGVVSGPAMLVAAAVGLAVLVWAMATRRWTARQRAWAFLTVPAVGHILLVGTGAHADVRFLFPAFTLLAVAAGLMAQEALSRPSGSALTSGGAVVVAAAVVAAIVLVVTPDVVAARESYARKFGTVRDTAHEIGRASGDDCFVVTSYAAQVLWYSGCGTARFQRVPPDDLLSPEIAVRDQRFDAGHRWFALFDGGSRQPEGEELERYIDLTAGTPDILVEGARRMAWGAAYRVETPPDLD